uniref:CUB domain-containing protein n=1 Tax=Tetranychus urticae TaxID=32264 RepID=T1KS93_TETUR
MFAHFERQTFQSMLLFGFWVLDSLFCAASYFCGEIDMPKNIISETPYVRIIFHSDSYSEDTHFQFSTEVQKQEEHWTKLGQFHKTRNRRGQLIPNTYCDKIIQDCSPGHCYIHSPGYPEIYPRNLKCRYLVKSPGGLIKLEIVDMDVDGEQCEGMLICFPRPVTRNYNQCLYDSIKIYDGSTSKDPLITTLCGRGRLSSNIIASQPWMLIEFESSPAGRLVDTGFQIKVETDIITDQGRSIEVSPDGSCVLQETITDSVDTNVFNNPRSWFPANTTCSYIFTVPNPQDHISIEFLSFTIERITLCEENIRIFDGLEPDPFRLMNILCDTNKPMGGASEPLYTTTGPSLLVQFHSSTGSLDGSSINYRFQVKRIVPEVKVSSELVSSNCSRLFTASDWSVKPFPNPSSSTSTSEQLNAGSFTINPSDFAFPINGKIHCNLTFDASVLAHGRVNLSIVSAFNSALTCGKYCDIGILGANQAKLLVHRAVDSTHFLSPLCYCEPTSREFPFNFQTEFLYKQGSKVAGSAIGNDVINFISNSSILRININLPSDWGRRPESKPIKTFGKV